MDFEAYKISEGHYQLHMVENGQKRWIASFNGLNTLLYYYIHCHNLTYDAIMFTGEKLKEDEQKHLNAEAEEWHINIKKE